MIKNAQQGFDCAQPDMMVFEFKIQKRGEMWFDSPADNADDSSGMYHKSKRLATRWEVWKKKDYGLWGISTLCMRICGRPALMGVCDE